MSLWGVSFSVVFAFFLNLLLRERKYFMATNENRQQVGNTSAGLNAQKIVATVPGLKQLLSAAQLCKIQDIFDAAILNPEIKKEAAELYRKSVISQSGSLILRDSNKVNQANKHLRKQIKVSEQDKQIRLDYSKMLNADALLPRTNNPDEMNYLLKVRQILQTKGVWLRLSQPFVQDSKDKSRSVLDPLHWELWFSLGFDGDAIPTHDCIIDRDELLKTTMLGAGYYSAVLTGPVQMRIKQILAHLDTETDDAFAEHCRLIQRYNQAAPGVAWTSDKLGGASLPSMAIWDRPRKLTLTAMAENAGGDVIKSQVYLVAAAKALQHNTEMIADYAEKSSSGAGVAIKWLKRARMAGKIAELGLVITGVGAAFRAIRGGSAVAADVAQQKALDEAAELLLSEYTKKAGISRAELAVTRYVPPVSNPSIGLTYTAKKGVRHP
jgi:hypothetical protein